jgi:hypothetical protein
VNGSILRKKYLESLARKGLSDHFLVLMASVKRVPRGGTGTSGKISHFLVAQHQKLPQVLPKWPVRATSAIFPATDITHALVVVADIPLPSAEDQRPQAFRQGPR